MSRLPACHRGTQPQLALEFVPLRLPNIARPYRCRRVRLNIPAASWHGTTILTVRKGGKVVIAGDGQVSLGQTIMKGNARKVRRLGKGDVIAGFAGATADAFTLFERLEAKLEQYPDQLMRACVELAKDWRTDRYLRRLEAMMIVADKSTYAGADRHRRRARARSMASWPSARAATTRWPRPARCSTPTLTPRRSPARRWRSPPRSASTPTPIWWCESLATAQ